jgi:integrase
MARRQFGTVRRLKSGRWQARYWDDTVGKQRSAPETFSTRRDASRWLALLESGRVHPVAVESRKAPDRLDEYAARWIESRPIRPRTAELYRLQLRRHIAPYLGDLKVARVQPAHIREWHATLSKDSGLHPTTVAKVYRLLRSILNTAVEDELLDANPCRIRNGGREESKERPIPSVGQVEAMAAAMPDHLAAVVWVAALGGLRKGEILGLARRHIDLESGTIVVERALQEITGQGPSLVEPKTRSSNRTVIMPMPLVAILSEHLDQHVDQHPEALVFTNSRGRPVRATVWSKAWREMRRETGYSTVRLHDLRHLAGTLTAQAGATLRETMDRLGHSSPTAAMRYQHVAAGRSRIIADRIAESVSPSRGTS